MTEVNTEGFKKKEFGWKIRGKSPYSVSAVSSTNPTTLM